MSFQQFELHPDILKAVKALGYSEPTSVQQQAIPIVLSGRDLIGCAPTGTGKTAAFALPILHKLHDLRRCRIRALILTPTRELAVQIHETIRAYAANIKIYTAAVFGGVGIPPQARALRLGTDIIVATPGRLLDHLNAGVGNFSNLEFLVLDEADRMLDMGFLPDVKRIISRMPEKRQTLLFSATMPTEIDRLCRQILRDPATIQIGRRSAPAQGISQSVYPVAPHLKTSLLLAMLKDASMDSVLIFTRTKLRTNRLTQALRQAGLEVAHLHGDRTQGQRIAALEGFRSGRSRILVATDIAARGLDVDGISHVINFDVPLIPEDYIHRIGRTARAAAIGAAYTLVSPAEESYLRAIEHEIKSRLARHTLPDFDYTVKGSPRRDDSPRRQPTIGGKRPRRSPARRTAARDSGNRAKSRQRNGQSRNRARRAHSGFVAS